jgi:hypothetical protein
VTHILALPFGRNLGDFVIQCMFAASVRDSLIGSRLTMLWRDDRPYKRRIAEMVGDADWLEMRGIHAIDVLDPHSEPAAPRDPVLFQAGIQEADLVLTPQMMRGKFIADLPCVARFKWTHPGTWNGLDENGAEHVCVHFREPNAPGRGAVALRDQDPAYWQLIVDRLREKGLEVVQIGHPGSTKLADVWDYTGLDFERQLKAIATARFNVMSASGPVSVSSAIDVPTLMVSTPEHGGVFHGHDMVTVPGVDGVAFDDMVIEESWMYARLAEERRIFPTPLPDVFDAIDLMMVVEKRVDAGVPVDQISLPSRFHNEGQRYAVYGA